MTAGFWLLGRAWAAIEPLLPKNQRGARRVDDRRVFSGIIHVLRIGCCWKDCPPAYAPPTTIYNRFNRWSHRGLWGRVFANPVRFILTGGARNDITQIESLRDGPRASPCWQIRVMMANALWTPSQRQAQNRSP